MTYQVATSIKYTGNTGKNSLTKTDDVAIGSNFSDVSSSIVVFRWCFGSDLVLFLDVSAVISMDASWKFL
jgi:hypothetical protein